MFAAAQRRRVRAERLAFTECPFRGAPLVVVSPGVDAADTLAVRVHEAVHADQCRALGPIRYRLRNLTATGKLSLEAPAYCAAAAARIRGGEDPRRVRERLYDDVRAAFAGLVDSAAVDASLHDCLTL